ncbi:hypothetical protein GGR57DRAFT_395921 [Xylariaceae sp. FL1272]|nr:hypothetical protein GGR57DRAFT_395921 [Xylariaceae sp. FL1272]
MSDVYTDHMTRVPKEGQRLNKQCDLMTECIGYVLNPAFSLSKQPRIVDIGTGTARFLMQVHPTVSPDAVLEGYDISSAQFPPKDVLPANITLGERDVKKPFPEDMQGQYDVVHLRMLVAAMDPDDWEGAVNNVIQLIKPGGYLQWEECDFVTAKWISSTTEPERPEDSGERLIRVMKASLGKKLENGWNTLPGLMQKAGLRPVANDIVTTEKSLATRQGFTDIILTLTLLFARLTASRGTPAFEQDADELEKAAYEEVRAGCYYPYNIHVACAQKPLL